MTPRHIVNVSEDASPMEREFLDALARLVDRQPRMPELAKAARRGLIRPSKSKVATEAGHSRTLITGKGGLVRVQVEIARAIAWYDHVRRPGSAVDALDEVHRERALKVEFARLREASADLRRQRDAAYTSSAAFTMLGVAIQQAMRVTDVDVIRLRRIAEQKAISNRSLSAL